MFIVVFGSVVVVDAVASVGVDVFARFAVVVVSVSFTRATVDVAVSATTVDVVVIAAVVVVGGVDVVVVRVASSLLIRGGVCFTLCPIAGLCCLVVLQ